MCAAKMADFVPLNINLDVGKRRKDLTIKTKFKLAKRAIHWRDVWEKEKRTSPPIWKKRHCQYVRPDPKWGFIS